MDLSTTYLGKRLPHPLVVGAGPLGDDLDTVKALEDAGAAMLVLRSLYEEEIVGEQMDAFFNVDGHSDSFSEAGSFEAESEMSLTPRPRSSGASRAGRGEQRRVGIEQPCRPHP